MFPSNPPAALIARRLIREFGVFVKFCFRILIISRRYSGIGESGVFGWGENGKNIGIYWINKFVLLKVKMFVIKKNNIYFNLKYFLFYCLTPIPVEPLVRKPWKVSRLG